MYIFIYIHLLYCKYKVVYLLNYLFCAFLVIYILSFIGACVVMSGACGKGSWQHRPLKKATSSNPI